MEYNDPDEPYFTVHYHTPEQSSGDDWYILHRQRPFSNDDITFYVPNYYPGLSTYVVQREFPICTTQQHFPHKYSRNPHLHYLQKSSTFIQLLYSPPSPTIKHHPSPHQCLPVKQHHFINNKGVRVMPTLESTAMTSDHLMTQNLDLLGPVLSEKTRWLRKTLGLDNGRAVGDVALHLAVLYSTSDFVPLDLRAADDARLVKRIVFKEPSKRNKLEVMPYFVDTEGQVDGPTTRAMLLLAKGLVKDQLPEKTLCTRTGQFLQEIPLSRIYKPVRFSRAEEFPTVPCYQQHTDYDGYPMLDDAPETRTAFLEVKQYLTSLLPNVKLFQIDRMYHTESFEDFNLDVCQLNTDNLLLRTRPSIFHMLQRTGFKLDFVETLITVFRTFQEPVSEDMFPKVTSLVLLEDGVHNFSWNWIAPITKNLTELRITIFNSTLIQAVKDLEKLLLLWIYSSNAFENNHTLDILSTLENPKLRSLSLHGVGQFTTNDVIKFLTKLVEHEGALVPRQDLMDDLTITGHDNDTPCLNYEEIYGSTAITPRMMARIYTDMDEDHEAAASLMLLRRGYYTSVMDFISNSRFLVYGQFLNTSGNTCPAYFKVINKISMEVSSDNLAEYFDGMKRIFSTVDDAQLYDSVLLSDTLESMTKVLHDRLFRRDPEPVVYCSRTNWSYTQETAAFAESARDFLDLFHDCDVFPKDVSLYLENIVALLDGSCKIGRLPQLFVDYSCQLSIDAFTDFVSRMKDMLIRICFQFIYSVRPPSDQYFKAGYQLVKRMQISDASKGMIELFLNHTQDWDMMVAARAVLRRSHPEQHHLHDYHGDFLNKPSLFSHDEASLERYEHILLSFCTSVDRYDRNKGYGT